MKELKSIEELESGITDERFLALFRAFVKALESKDYNVCIKLTILRYLITKCKNLNLKSGEETVYRIVIKVLAKKDYLFWEKQLLIEKIVNN